MRRGSDYFKDIWNTSNKQNSKGASQTTDRAMESQILLSLHQLMLAATVAHPQGGLGLHSAMGGLGRVGALESHVVWLCCCCFLVLELLCFFFLLFFFLTDKVIKASRALEYFFPHCQWLAQTGWKSVTAWRQQLLAGQQFPHLRQNTASLAALLQGPSVGPDKELWKAVNTHFFTEDWEATGQIHPTASQQQRDYILRHTATQKTWL